jgi:hypothetical protein
MHFFLEFELKQKKNKLEKEKKKKKKAIPVADQAKTNALRFFSCWPQHATDGAPSPATAWAQSSDGLTDRWAHSLATRPLALRLRSSKHTTGRWGRLTRPCILPHALIACARGS